MDTEWEWERERARQNYHWQALYTHTHYIDLTKSRGSLCKWIAYGSSVMDLVWVNTLHTYTSTLQHTNITIDEIVAYDFLHNPMISKRRCVPVENFIICTFVNFFWKTFDDICIHQQTSWQYLSYMIHIHIYLTCY